MNTAAHFELPFFTNLLVLLVAARLFGELFERIKQPAMIGEIIAGIILGPSVLNLIHRTEAIKVISELGIFLLVIIAGLELNVDNILKSLRGKSIIISLFAFFIPILGGVYVGYVWGYDIVPRIFIGLCVAITALPVSIRILMDLDKINSEVGQKIISVAIFDDILALTILGILLSVKNTNLSIESILQVGAISLLKLCVFVFLLSLAYLLIRKISLKGNYFEAYINNLVSLLKGKESLFAIFFMFVLLFATVSESLGLHFIVGAFFASMLISESFIGKENLLTIEKSTTNIAMGFLTPIFFAGIGLEFNISAVSNLGFLVAVILVSYFSKIVGGFLGGLLAGLNQKVAFALGVGLNARGIMELVIADIAYEAGLINNEIFSTLVIMGMLTTLTTPMMLKKVFSRQ